MPGMPRNGIICTNSACSTTGIMSMPSGLALVEAILATSLFAAMPTEQGDGTVWRPDRYPSSDGAGTLPPQQRAGDVHIAFIHGNLFDAIGDAGEHLYSIRWDISR